MGSGGSKSITELLTLGNKIKEGAQYLGNKFKEGGSNAFNNLTGFVENRFNDVAENVTDPLLSKFRPVTEIGGKIFDIKNEFIDKLPFSKEILTGLETMPYVGDKIKLLNDIERTLKLINAGRYKDAQQYMIKAGIEKYIGSKLPNNIKNKMYERAGLDTV